MAESNPGAAFAPNAYANAFVPAKPRDSANLVQQRLRKAKLFNEELADYFAARRELEETYLKQLQKIAKRNFLSDPSSIPPGYAPVYERLIQELAEVASAHAEFEKRIAQDCEEPIRNASSKAEWGRIKDHDDSLANTLRELNSLESQLQKDQKKLEAASSKKASQANAKVQETERAIAQTMDIWETEAPFAFEAYQRIDAQRLELLKETVAKFETAQSDAAQRIMSSSEKTMQECLTFDTQADMQDFILKNGVVGATASSSARNGRSAAATAATASSRPSAAPATAGLNRQSSIASRSISSRTGVEPSARGRSNGGGMGEFGASTASIHSADRTQDGTPTKSAGSTLKNAFSRFGRGRSNKDSSNTQTIYGGLPDEPADSSFSSMNRSGTLRQNSTAPGAASSSRNPATLTAGDDSIDSMAPGSGGGLMAPLTPSTAPTRNNSTTVPAALPSSSTVTGAPLVDSEGYSIPPPDRKPWETAAGAAAGAGAAGAGAVAGSSLLDDDDNDASRDTFDSTLNNRVTNMNISSQPITEDASKDKAALERMKSTLLTTGPPTRRGTTRRDRRDVRNTTYNPAFGAVGSSGDDSRLCQFGALTASPQTSVPGSPSPFGTQSTFTGTAGVGRHRTQSIASVASSTTNANPFENSSTSSPIKASLSERVNVIFVGREISKVMVVGELSVAVGAGLTAAASSKPLHIRIEAFEQLEKAAPNPAFLKPVPGGSTPGEYLLDLKSLLEQGAGSGLPGSASQAVVLKYQLHISDARKSEYVPLQLHAQWRCEPHQTSFLMTYTPNSSCRFSSADASPTVLQDLQFAVSIQPSAVSNIMSKPTATFVAETKSLFWKITDNLALANAPDEVHKLLARCQIHGAQTVPSPVHLKWKILGSTISSLGISTVGEPEAGASIDEVVRQCVAGKFIASP
ncbi:related to SYP1/YCR030C [Sporisorium reilianum f. sp. reilianum]|uniref:Related to SYP1/YCR030C n=1 Tax=Sporisorium reilianum f. sp. reilianum TaxID=72559 RepID=A0A2N8UMY9_9BASI|nr:related to SYP1/YCR030C [Sporisorium reilianum f. sp. reilianum]